MTVDPSARAIIDPPMGTRAGVGDWGLLAVAAGLAGLLVISSLSSFVGAHELSETLVRGEGEMIYNAIRSALPDDRASDDDLASILEAEGARGLRYVAILGRDGRVIAGAGSPAAEPLREPEAGDHGVVRWLEDNLRGERASVRFERLMGPPQGVSAPRPPLGARPRMPPPRVVIEVEPQLARASFQRAFRDLLISLAVALAWIVASGIFYRLRRRARKAEADLSERRHLAALGEMSAVIAHEIRNPLASLKGHAQLLEEQLADNERRQAKARRIVNEAVRLEELTKSLLDFVRAGNLKEGDSDPRGLAIRAAEMVDAARVNVDAGGAPPGWPLDAMRMEQVLVNLLRNGLQASPAGASVDLRVAAEDGGLVFEIADRGKGIPEEMRERLFDPFVTGRTQGTGLGLAVVHRVTERHGGDVRVCDRPGGGTIFRVWLPQKRPRSLANGEQ